MFTLKQKYLEKAYDKAAVLFVKNRKKGMQMMKKLYRMGSPKAASFYRLCLLYGIQKYDNMQDRTRILYVANKLLIKAADNGDSASQCELAGLYEIGKGFPQNDHEAFRYYLMAAENGDAVAQTNIARYYAMGIGVEHNAKQAVYWDTRAAQQGSTIAMVNMANGYEFGKGYPQDNNQAIAWYMKALETAKHNLATQGKGVKGYYEKNEKKAIDIATRGLRRIDMQILCEEYQKLKDSDQKKHTLMKIESYAKEGEWCAQYYMGVICEEAKNYADALKWYEEASENGSSGGMRNIGLMYFYGKGVQRSYELAYKWFKKAVDYAANTYSMYMLGVMYDKGLYVRQDTEIAISWYIKADLQGCAEAAERLEEIRKNYIANC